MSVALWVAIFLALIAMMIPVFLAVAKDRKGK